MTTTPRWSENDIDQLVGRLLQVGVLIAASVVIVGLPFFLAHHGHQTADFRAFQGQPARLRNLTDMLRAALALDPAAIVQVGVLLLIATPIARVALTLIAFLVRRDAAFVALSAIVLAILLFGLISGRI